LLSLTSNPPEPLGGLNTHFLHPAIGVPVMIAVGGILYFRQRLGADARVVWPLMTLFVVAFFCCWSPINFWAALPRGVMVAQFPYRFLTYTSAIGAVLFGYFAMVYGRLYQTPTFLGWLVGIILATQPYLPNLGRNVRPLLSVIAQPDLGYSTDDYLYRGD